MMMMRMMMRMKEMSRQMNLNMRLRRELLTRQRVSQRDHFVFWALNWKLLAMETHARGISL